MATAGGRTAGGTDTAGAASASQSAQNHYDVLGLERRATQDDVRSAYRLRSHMFHPDKYENYPEPLRTQLKAEAAKEFKKLTAAYDTLRDPQKRAAHDRQLDAMWVRPPAAGRAGARPSRASTRPVRTTTRTTPGRTTVRDAVRDAAEADAEETKQAAREAQRQERARRRAAEAAAAARPRERDPHLVVRPDELDFGAMALGTTKQLPVKIANAGGRTLFGEISSNRSWLGVNRRSFVSSSVLVLVSVDTNGLRAGEEYTGALAVTTLNGGDQVVPVSVRVSGRPEPLLAGVPSLLDFGTAEGGSAGTKTRTIRLTNAGTGTLIGSIAIRYGARADGAQGTQSTEGAQGAQASEEDQGKAPAEGSHAAQAAQAVETPEWLSVSESRFRANDFSFEVIARTAGLAAGEHRGEILVYTNGGQARIQAVIQITPGATLSRRVDPEDEDAGAARPPIQNPKSQIQNGPLADLDKKDRDALLKRIVRIEPESTFEREFLRRIVHLVRSGTPLAPGELAKIYELEARQPAEEPHV